MRVVMDGYKIVWDSCCEGALSSYDACMTNPTNASSTYAAEMCGNAWAVYDDAGNRIDEGLTRAEAIELARDLNAAVAS